MCGIAGVFDLFARREIPTAKLRAMTQAIANRGPDGQGVWAAEGIGLGHRRLSLIDFEGGAQPMSDESESVWISFNGEIYNFESLKAQLRTQGAQFRTRSDTEVLIEGWKRWGTDLPLHLEGFFAVAIYDVAKESLFLLRDRWGKKPLYLSQRDGFLFFGSDIKAILAAQDGTHRLNETAIIDFLSYGYVPETKSIYQDITKLPPAHYLYLARQETTRQTTAFQNDVLTPKRYWRAKVNPFVSGDSNATDLKTATVAATIVLQEKLQAATARRMIADAPLGVFLSGGVDSAAMLAMASQASAQPLNAFTMQFENPALDETALAAATAALYGAKHIVQPAGIDAFSDAQAVFGAFSEPFADASAMPMLRLCRLAQPVMKVAISGDGGDELFCGYRRYPFHIAEERVKARLPELIRRTALAPLAKAYPAFSKAPRFLRAKATLSALAGDQAAGLFRATVMTPPERLSALLSETAQKRLSGYDPADWLRHHALEANTEDALARAQYIDLNSWLPSRMLVKTDRASMAAGVEIRNPLLDAQLADWAMQMPNAFKLQGHQGKVVLKQALAGLAPSAVLNATKRGFTPPLAAWLQGPLYPLIESLLQHKRIFALDLFDERQIQALVTRLKRGDDSQTRTLWALIVLDQFLHKHYVI